MFCSFFINIAKPAKVILSKLLCQQRCSFAERAFTHSGNQHKPPWPRQDEPMIGKVAGLVLQQSLTNVNRALLAGKWLSGLDPGSAEMSRRLFLICSGANPQIKTNLEVCVGSRVIGLVGHRGLLARAKGSSNFNFLH